MYSGDSLARIESQAIPESIAGKRNEVAPRPVSLLHALGSVPLRKGEISPHWGKWNGSWRTQTKFTTSPQSTLHMHLALLLGRNSSFIWTSFVLYVWYSSSLKTQWRSSIANWKSKPLSALRTTSNSSAFSRVRNQNVSCLSTPACQSKGSFPNNVC